MVDAGFGVAALLTGGVPRFVARVARNFTARRNVLPAYTGRGRRPAYGERVRPLPRTHKGRTIAASPPDATAQWVVAGRTIQAQVWDNLVLSTAKPGAPAFRCAVIHDPRYQEPWVLATNLPVSAYALWCLYRDRWPIEQMPLAAKQMVGAHRAFVFGEREPPPPAGVGAVGGQCLDLCGGHVGGRGHGLLGSVLPSDVWALASGAAARGFFRDPRAGRATAEKGVGDGAFAQGCAGASASEGRHNTPSQQPSTAESRLI